MLNYTKGEWLVEKTQMGKRIVCKRDGKDVGVVAVVHHQTFQKGVNPLGCGSGSRDEINANAHLIALAPSLFEGVGELKNALERLLEGIKAKTLTMSDVRERIVEMLYNYKAFYNFRFANTADITEFVELTSERNRNHE
ncbi:MAG: hypothetical protein IJG38_07525 [Thermoguttaceae bacterium]|nr:hypothetical protein [Thermoguttaceae bacterium]